MSADDLKRYGYTPGKVARWCAMCMCTFRGGPTAFKCQPCARKQQAEVDRICRSTDYGRAVREPGLK